METLCEALPSWTAVRLLYAPTRTVVAHGQFTSDPYELDQPEHGCHLAIRYELDGWIPGQRSAPPLAAHVDLSVRQGSYRGLDKDELNQLVAAIRAHPAYVAS
jgi:hypothetical protein